MVTLEEIQKRNDEDAILIKTMVIWLVGLNEYDHVEPKTMFEDCRAEALGE